MNQTEEMLKHDIYLQRFATQLVESQLFPSIDATYKLIRLILLDAEEITSITKLNAITREIDKSVSESLSGSWDAVTAELMELAEYEIEWATTLLGAVAGQAIAKPAASTVKDLMNKALMSLSSGSRNKVGVWSEFVSDNIASYAEQVNNLVKVGYINGQTTGQITRAIKQFNDGLARSDAESLARTGVAHYSQQARKEMVKENADVIDREYPLVMFDNRRSIICSGIYMNHKDGWKAGESPVGYPPYHFRCRTQIIYGIKGQGDPRGNMPAIGAGADYPDDADKKPVYKGRKDLGKFKIESVKYGTDLDVWMKDQGFAFVADNLGATRAKLLFDGKLSLARMSDAFGNPLTLDQLRQRDAEAFKRAGL